MELLMKLDKCLQKLEGAYAPNTLRSYYADARAFVDWCAKRNIEPFPIASETLCAYIECLQMNSAYSSIRRRISSLRRLNKMLGFEDQTRTEEVYLAIRRLKRSKCMEQKQAVGINHDTLIKMIAAQPDTLAGTRNRALLSLGYDFLARRSELTALEIGDIKFSEGGGLRALIRRSKGDQFGRGRLVYGSRRSAKHLRAWLKCLPEGGGLIFRAVCGAKVLDRPLCGRSVSNIVKLSVVKARGARPHECEVSGHSLRVGAAQDLLIRGYDLAAIMRAGGWSDPSTVPRYLRFSQHNIWK